MATVRWCREAVAADASSPLPVLAEMHVYRPIDTHAHLGEHAPMLASPLRGA